MKNALVFLAALVSLAAGGHAWSQTYPDKPIKIVVGFPPGTTGDVLARIMAPKLSEGLGQPVVVENRPGAGSSIGAEIVARSPADGYTLLVSTIANTINPALYKSLSFDFSKDLVPVTLLAEVPGLLVTHPGAPANVQALIAAAKAKPGDISYGSSGNGTVTHLWGELFNVTTGTRLSHIPYKGSSQAITDILSGRIGLLFTPASTVVSHVKAGTLLAIGAIGRQRIAALPDVPTLAEAGVAGFEASLWFGLNAPAGTPRNIIDRLNREVARVLALPEVRAQLTAQTIDILPGGTEPFAALIGQETEKWARVVQTAGVKVQ
jgi:tripartite-type tricarboxylate transporter receptor subunit TctC